MRKEQVDGQTLLHLNISTPRQQYVSCGFTYNPETEKYEITSNHLPNHMLESVANVLDEDWATTVHMLVDNHKWLDNDVSLANLTKGFMPDITSSNFEGDPMYLAIIQFSDEDYDYSKGDGIVIVGIYECKYSVTATIKL